MDMSQTRSLGNPGRDEANRGGIETAPVPRVTSGDLLRGIREIEIDHGGRIYRLRLTHSNKLILTA
jgi:hemin uptake protein HemP